MGQQVLLALAALALACVHIQTVLALLREGNAESHEVTAHVVRHVARQLFLLDAVFVQGGHEVGERPRHAELQLELAPCEHQGVLVRHRDQPK